MKEDFVKRGFLFQFSTDAFLGSDVSILTAAKRLPKQKEVVLTEGVHWVVLD